MRLILASGSPRRRELLARLGLPFTIVRPDIDESVRPAEPADRYVARLSREKATAVRASLPLADLTMTLIIAADTTVAVDSDILGKPESADEATAMLTRLRGRAHLVYTGVTVCIAESGEIRTEVERSDVGMRDYTDLDIARYVDSGDAYDKAGGYAIQSADLRPVARIGGCYANVVGLPLTRLTAMLADCGLHVPVSTGCHVNDDPVNGCLVRW